MARLYCQQCGIPLPRRAKQCLQCDTTVEQNITLPEKEPTRVIEWVAICCVASSCLVFIVALGLTHLFQDGGMAIGAGSFASIVLSIYWVGKQEAAKNRDDSTTH
ncbi:MAG: hypothetical protein BA874_07435 [Desulfuromonadales bacterium C00003068]|jgi:hypothetical protein|nr:MAG: hypothetical protein BA874_07435 [Desulfuromonadales bacterium C00003068]